MRQKYKGDDIRARLNGTIIRWKGVPYLADVSGDGQIALLDVATGNLIARIESDDDNIDISSINIGYVNIINPDYKTAVYLKREPTRQFRQGIAIDHLTQKVLRKDLNSVPRGAIMSTGFVDAVMGRFPSIDGAFDLITKKGWFSVAISRDIAVRREADLLKVYLKESEVGYIRLGTKKLIVPKTEQSYYHVALLSDIKGWEVSEGLK
jgi:hypothetical protein